VSQRTITKEEVQAAIVAVIELCGGSISHRILMDKLWSTMWYAGSTQVEEWLREVAAPDFEPPLPETRWRLK
jgi:hypothetical protein